MRPTNGAMLHGRPWLRGKPLPEEFKFTDYTTTRNEFTREELSFKTI